MRCARKIDGIKKVQISSRPAYPSCAHTACTKKGVDIIVHVQRIHVTQQLLAPLCSGHICSACMPAAAPHTRYSRPGSCPCRMCFIVARCVQMLNVNFGLEEEVIANGDLTDDPHRVETTVFELAGPDRPGLLADVTQLLTTNDCDVRSAAVGAVLDHSPCKRCRPG